MAARVLIYAGVLLSSVAAIAAVSKKAPPEVTAPKPATAPAAGGDEVGPNSQEFSFPKVALKKGQLLRLVIDPNKWWGTDMTRIDDFKIKRVK